MLGVCRLYAGDLGHSRSVSRRVRSIFFQLALIMSISNEVQEFINYFVGSKQRSFVRLLVVARLSKVLV